MCIYIFKCVFIIYIFIFSNDAENVALPSQELITLNTQNMLKLKTIILNCNNSS